MAITQPEDVASRLGRTLTPDEENLTEVLLDDAEDRIRVRLPGRVFSENTIDFALLVQVAANAVVRVLRNPDGYRSEAVGGVSYTIDTRAAAGFLTILGEEWSLLGLTPPSTNGGAGSFAPALGTAYGTPLWAAGWHSPWP